MDSSEMEKRKASLQRSLGTGDEGGTSVGRAGGAGWRSYITNYGSIGPPSSNNSTCSTAKLITINGRLSRTEAAREDNKFKALSSGYETSGYETTTTGNKENDKESFKLFSSSSSLNSSIEEITSITTGGGSRENIIDEEEEEADGDGENGAHNDKGSSLLDRAAKKIPCLGIIFALCASVFLGSAGMLVKMTVSVHGVQVAIFRRLPWRPDRDELKPVLGRALLGALSITFSYYALKLIPLGDATTIRFSMPIWSLIVGYLMLNESCSLLKICAVLACIAGVVLIAKPDFCLHILYLVYGSLFHHPTTTTTQPQNNNNNNSTLPLESWYDLKGNVLYDEPAGSSLLPVDGQFAIMNETGTIVDSIVVERSSGEKVEPSQFKFKQLEGSLLALSSSICLALSLVALRLCKKTQVEITILWLSVASVLVGFCLLASINGLNFPNNWPDVLYILLNGLCGSIGQWFITSALKIEQSGIISLARTADIQVAFLYSALLLHEPIRMTSVVGSVLVSCGVLSVAIPKLFSNNNNNSEENGGWCCCFSFCSPKLKLSLSEPIENININHSNEGQQQPPPHYSSGGSIQNNRALSSIEWTRKGGVGLDNANATSGIKNYNTLDGERSTGSAGEKNKTKRQQTKLPVVFVA